jgi:N-acyl-D-aspartate/D-glutamate deacylase
MGPADRRATPDDIDRMRAIIVRGLENGAWGVSSGLDYKPAYYAQVEEVIEVVDAASKWRTNFPNHDRITPESNFSSRVGIAETIAIGEKAGLVPVITHMKAQGVEQGTASRLLQMMHQATKRGRYTAADVYPYLAGQTSLGALLVPAWAQDGGRDEMLKRFKDPAARQRIVTEIEQAMNARFNGAAGVFLPATQQQLVDIMRDEQVSAGEAVVRILEQDNVTAILRFGTESDLVKILRDPTTSIACDCGASTNTRQHPRAFGTFPRVLGRYVREQKVLTWEDAVRKMTALPAATIGMIDRGYLAPGMTADVTVFDPITVIDRATYEDPGRLSEGIRHVLVNGRLALRDGTVTGEQGGRVLLRDRHMPSRPMNGNAARRLSAAGTLRVTPESTDGHGAARVTIRVTQAPNARRATGSFRLVSGDRTIAATEFGVLQSSRGWATFTARGRSAPSGNDVSLCVVVDDEDPFATARGRVVVITVDGATRVSGVLQ